MQINKKLSQSIYEDAGSEKLEKAKRYVFQSRVEIKEMIYDDKDNFEVTAEVDGNYDDYLTRIRVAHGELEEASCECPDYQNTYGSCKHIVATLLKFEQTKFWDRDSHIEDLKKSTNNEVKFNNFRKIVNELYNEELQEINAKEISELPEEKKIKIEPRIIHDRFETKLKLELKIGTSRMYKIKDLTDFYTRMTTGDFYKYGDRLEFMHKKENFVERDSDILDFVLKYSEMLKFAENTSKYSYYGSTLNHSSIVLGENLMDEIFDILKNKKVLLEEEKSTSSLELIENDPDIRFELIKTEEDNFKIKCNKDVFGIQMYKGKNYTYVLENSKLYRCSEEFLNTIVKLVKLMKSSYIFELHLRKEDLKDLYSVVMPKIGDCIKLKNVSEKEIEKFKPKKLAVKIFLDFDKNDYIIADVKFCYGQEEFNPLDNDIRIQSTRNILEENRNLNILRMTGFMIDKKNTRFILPENDKIYNFLSNDIEIYMQKFEVLATENFKTKEIRRPKIGTIGVRVENNLLSIDLSKINIDVKELQDIMQRYELKKKYYRLKDGSFLNLEENKDIEFLDKMITGMNLEYKDLEKETINLPVNRSLYLNELLKKEQMTNVTKNNEFNQIITNLEQDHINDEISIPRQMESVLRDYQKIGYKWLKVLDSYKFGGILADDMGLGKTLQVLTMILEYVENSKDNKRATIVVAPSSLTLNWLAEAKKFTPELKVEVIKGTALERKRRIENIKNYDLVITSYDLLKRDINEYEELNYNFRYIIADEAQYMKNSSTQNAKAIKELNADSRFALTGTPIENSLAELWSIFDFIMPGYLFSYRKFKEWYESPIVKDKDERAMNKLKMLIAPFILRRNKKDVLTELPEKTITVLNNQMTDEQEKIYMSYLAQIKEDVAAEINMNGFEKSQIKILAALTRLRQICCHPGLFIRDYKGESSKLTQCVEIVNDAIEAGHKILLFSGYTSMFEILEKELKAKEIKYFKLTGSTKVDERIKLVDEFNLNPDVKIFLISLKAGGTGLNLTGADMVIHYDPWWNQSAENQATDRAYRIGQKNNVQVYKLITSNSIEEKIYELQQKKATLIDNMLDNKTSFINKLSKDEIMTLFS